MRPNTALAKHCAGAERGGDNTLRLIVGEAGFALLTTGSHMSALGHKRTLRLSHDMSVFPPKADILRPLIAS
jgi:hypothetical protein